jgi:cyclopropane fatty-acyl-phospholipid synthase-like methyltransferase
MFFNNPQSRLQFLIRKEKLFSRLFGKKLDIEKSWEQTPGKLDDMLDFLNWFNTTTSIEECLKMADRDWRFFFQANERYAAIKKGAALEIGFGGGRLLLQASREFKQVYGVDIHNAFPISDRFLRANGATNHVLVHRDQALEKISAGSIDYVYSFIVFQHFATIDEVNFYLDLIAKVLTPDGVAHIYFGKSAQEGVTTTKTDDFVLRDCSLFINLETMKNLISRKFRVLEASDNLYRDPENKTGESVQAFVVFRKN